MICRRSIDTTEIHVYTSHSQCVRLPFQAVLQLYYSCTSTAVLLYCYVLFVFRLDNGWTTVGRLSLRPLEPGGQGPLKEYTRAMLHSIVTKEPVAAQLITWHNLWFMLNLLTATWIHLETIHRAPTTFINIPQPTSTCHHHFGMGVRSVLWSFGFCLPRLRRCGRPLRRRRSQTLCSELVLFGVSFW